MRTSSNVYVLENEEQCNMNQIDESKLWHRRIGHLNFNNIVKISKKGVVRNLLKIIKPPSYVCRHHLHGKQTKTSFKIKEHTPSQRLEIIQTDLCGPTRTKSMQGERYLMSFIDDYTRMTWVAFLKRKSKVFMKSKSFKALVENETTLKIKCIRSDNGGEFTSKEFRGYR